MSHILSARGISLTFAPQGGVLHHLSIVGREQCLDGAAGLVDADAIGGREQDDLDAAGRSQCRQLIAYCTANG